EIIKAFSILKEAAAITNNKLGKLDDDRAEIISKVCKEIYEGKLDENFPLVVWQTGSGTQSNMNVNEVVANRANEILDKEFIHPNDHVNMSQSSNDTFPTAMSLASIIALEDNLLPAVEKLKSTFERLEEENKGIIKTGRTHLQDAVPISFSQEISGWTEMLKKAEHNILESMEDLRELALGGTAVGTGLNAHKDFGRIVAEEISFITDKRFKTAENKFYSLTSKSDLSYTHGALKSLAADLMKISNDIRWLASGPRCGIGEISIPENEPGSSIMPGKINPTQSEALTMIVAQIMGNDTTIGFGASQGHFQLNVFMPVMIYNFLQSTKLLSDGIISFNDYCAVGIKPIKDRMEENLEKSLMLVTALNPHIGYEKAAKVAKTAHETGKSLRETVVELGYLTEDEFNNYIKPEEMV
ncbi:MAG TPA: class II fumarate hydratase, partial [Tissierellaceae bacterium]|nr:class II fumarate hydratase [Tissierellaceae bacterium]